MYTLFFCRFKRVNKQGFGKVYERLSEVVLFAGQPTFLSEGVGGGGRDFRIRV